ncbi:2-succinyl-5-enolpyruvyl-6-hydroxy-3-cyclohexene-1-carboxylic-acid synthase [Propionicicella superfundia]|uniref:2-succinyl-5-enolpyruvyl-6-hydroxy-3- cyclohexene-1-carboxylic-acid synthase n=1 Tax=Propionicicella superfundia TaxID=348582 RepID=UPI000428D9A4|nr:2-succinyl-5-enolpyruvyl-6-hydroxy-3-cyclohexene-1-carboxylic-acid synthase [Propionicicella superfundia]
MSASSSLGAAVVAHLVAQGVTDIVVAPGSRSGPLAVAAARSAARLHVRVDERSGCFLALGIARAQGRPVAIVTTSGTAVGNLLPAVMEADHAGVPLVVVSADRPSSLVGTGANQTTRQVGVFAGFVRDAVRVASSEDPRSWGAHVARAVVAAAGTLSADPGPVHVNVELADPLLGTAAAPAVSPLVASPRPGPAPVELRGGPATVVVAGDASAAIGMEAAAFAAVADLPLIAEPSSNARSGAALSCGRLLLDTELGAAVERVIVFGHPTLSRPVTRLLSRDGVEIVAVSGRPTWPDPTWRVRTVAGGVRLDPEDGAWTSRWRAADALLAADVARSYGEGETGWRLAAGILSCFAAAGDEAGALFVGPSQIVRDLDLAPVPARSPLVYANRGLAGIDGVVSSAAGVALGADAPVTLVCGDLTFLHDSNGLLRGSGPEPVLRIVVADDDGGSIFATLESGAVDPETFDRVYRTAQGVDLVALATGYGVPARRASVDEALVALREPPRGIEVIVVPVDASRLRERVSSLPGRAAAAVAAAATRS